jgi:hypothetical protein
MWPSLILKIVTVIILSRLNPGGILLLSADKTQVVCGGDGDQYQEVTMITVTIQDKYLETLSALGDVQVAVDLALQRYTIEQVTAKIAQLRRRAAEYQTKYGLDYSTFVQRIAQDEEFVRQVEMNISLTWESDAADWEFCARGIEDWTNKLQAILLTS